MKSISINNLFETYFEKRGYPSFWILNAIGWILIVLADTFIVSPELLESWNRVISNTVQWSMGYLLTIGLREIYKNFQYRTKSLILIIGYILLCSFISSVLLITISHIIFKFISPSDFEQLWIQIVNIPFQFFH